MRGSRNNHILAGTALALVFAIPLVSLAKDPTKLAVAPMAATPEQAPAQVEQAPAQAAPAIPATELPAASSTAAPDAAAAAPQAAAPDPLASLDPADRAVAEKLRDLLAAKSDKLFANKKERAAVRSEEHTSELQSRPH